MNVLVLLGSPHKNGTTAALAESFCKGALEAGHDVETAHTPSLKIHACTGCNHCRKSGYDSICISVVLFWIHISAKSCDRQILQYQ